MCPILVLQERNLRNEVVHPQSFILRTPPSSDPRTPSASTTQGVTVTPSTCGSSSSPSRKLRREFRCARGGFWPHADKRVGVPLSQFDLAEVQMAFAPMCLAIFEREILAPGVPSPLSTQDKKDMLHCWRLIGFLLGIQDKFNVCNSLEQSEDYVREFQV